MNGNAFIRMMYEDVETHPKKAVLKSVVGVMDYVVGLHPDCEIPSDKNAEDCYRAIFEAAKRNSVDGQGNTWCVSTPDLTIETVSKYLGLSETSEKNQKPVNVSASTGGGTISLEDFL